MSLAKRFSDIVEDSLFIDNTVRGALGAITEKMQLPCIMAVPGACDDYGVAGYASDSSFVGTDANLAADEFCSIYAGLCADRFDVPTVLKREDFFKRTGRSDEPWVEFTSIAILPLIFRGERLGVIFVFSRKGLVLDDIGNLAELGLCVAARLAKIVRIHYRANPKAFSDFGLFIDTDDEDLTSQ